MSQAHKNREWTPEEQASLEAAIKQVPSSDPDRWRNVAKLVPGRSRKECVQRIKEIRDQVRGEVFLDSPTGLVFSHISTNLG